MQRHRQLLIENKAWAKDVTERDADFFTRMAQSQAPNFLWIGCSDSRVSPTEITQTKPGELFIHRNVANLVVHTDVNLLSVLQYAVEALKIKHVVVCGHYGCGGVKTALTRQSLGMIDKWLRHIKDVYRLHQQEVDACGTEEEKVNRLVECNVREQVYHVAQTSIIQKAWKRDNAPTIHGWVFCIKTGLLKPLLEMEPGTHFDHPIYEYDNL
ncbi:MAG: carbonic anhydrase [Rickettsiales bacterium]